MMISKKIRPLLAPLLTKYDIDSNPPIHLGYGSQAPLLCDVGRKSLYRYLEIYYTFFFDCITRAKIVGTIDGDHLHIEGFLPNSSVAIYIDGVWIYCDDGGVKESQYIRLTKKYELLEALPEIPIGGNTLVAACVRRSYDLHRYAIHKDEYAKAPLHKLIQAFDTYDPEALFYCADMAKRTLAGDYE